MAACYIIFTHSRHTRVHVHACMYVYTHTCLYTPWFAGRSLRSPSPPPLLRSFHLCSDMGRLRGERNRLVSLPVPRGFFPSPRGGCCPYGARGRRRASRARSGLWGCLASAMMVDLRFRTGIGTFAVKYSRSSLRYVDFASEICHLQDFLIFL